MLFYRVAANKGAAPAASLGLRFSARRSVVRGAGKHNTRPVNELAALQCPRVRIASPASRMCQSDHSPAGMVQHCRSTRSEMHDSGTSPMTGSMCEYRFTISGHRPETLPMSRLASYMDGLARLLGEADQVHFVRPEPGSTVLVQQVEPGAEPRVRGRVLAVSRREGSPDAMKAFRELDRQLTEQDAFGSLQTGGGTELLPFRGCKQLGQSAIGPFSQLGYLDGVLIRIGGTRDPVPVGLEDGERVHKCLASRRLAKRLAVDLFGAALRVDGKGRWVRESNGNWELRRFAISDFIELDESPPSEVVERLRRVEGGEWGNIDDPCKELARLRSAD